MFFPTQVRAHHSGSRRMPTRWPANCSVSPGSCDSLERAPGLRRPGCSSGAAPSTRPRRPCTFSRTTASTTSTNNTAPRTHREYHEQVRGKSSPHPEGGGPPWMKTPHDEPRWSFSAGKCRNPDFVSEFQFRVGGVSVFQVRVGAQGACGEGSTRRRVWVSRMTYGSGNLHQAGLTGHLWGARRLTCGVLVGGSNRDGVRSTTRPDLRPVRSCRRADVSERADGRVRPTGSRHWARLNEDDQFLAVGCRRDPMLRKNDGGLLCFRSAVAISLSFSRLSKRLHRRPLYLRGKV